MTANIFEDWSATEDRSLDARRIERERMQMREARIEVTEYLDAADLARYFPQIARSTTT